MQPMQQTNLICLSPNRCNLQRAGQQHSDQEPIEHTHGQIGGIMSQSIPATLDRRNHRFQHPQHRQRQDNKQWFDVRLSQSKSPVRLKLSSDLVVNLAALLFEFLGLFQHAFL